MRGRFDQIWKILVFEGSDCTRVADAASGAHHLHVADFGAALVAEAILMGDRAFADMGDDLHIGGRMVAGKPVFGAISSSFHTVRSRGPYCPGSWLPEKEK